MVRTGRGASEAVDHFWPGAVDGERSRVAARVRKWAQLARAGVPARQAAAEEDADPPARGPTPAAAGDRPPPDYDTVRLDRIPFLEWQLAELIADLRWSRNHGVVGKVAALDTRISEVRQHLDQARSDAGSQVKLDRNPAAVAAEVERRKKRIAELAGRAGRERDL